MKKSHPQRARVGQCLIWRGRRVPVARPLRRIPVWSSVSAGKKKDGKAEKKGVGGLTQQLNKLFYLESRSHNQTGLKGKLQAHEGGLVSPSSNIFNLGG